MLNVPPLPLTEFYDVSALYLTQARRRQAGDPPFNPAHRIKGWVGSGPGLLFFENGQLVPHDVPPEEDGVNFLPDLYPPYVIAPTRATLNGAPVPAEWLSTLEQAAQIFMEMKATQLTTDDRVSYPAGEMRRLYMMVVDGVHVAAGYMLAIKNALGVGHPGHWAPGPKWVSDPDPAIPDNIATWDVPCRALIHDDTADEEIEPFILTALGWTYHVHNKKLAPPDAPGAGMTRAQEHKLDLILQKLGIPLP
jgi:hypothetical protein